MASSSGLDLKTARHLSAALQIPFDRAQAVGSLRLFRPHHFQQLSKQRQGIGLTIQLSCPLKPFLHPGSFEKLEVGTALPNFIQFLYFVLFPFWSFLGFQKS